MLCSEELRRWFIQQEVDLFRFRFQQESAESRARFMVCNSLNYHPVSVLSFLLLLEASWNMLHWRKLGGQASTVFGHLYAGNSNTSRAWIWNPKEELLYKYNACGMSHTTFLYKYNCQYCSCCCHTSLLLSLSVSWIVSCWQMNRRYYWGVVVVLCFMNSAVLTWTGGTTEE